MTTSSLPGVRVTRRSLLELPLLAALLPPRVGMRRQEPLPFQDFTTACAERIQAHAELDFEFAESLLHELGGLAARLEAASVPRPSLGAFGGYEPKVGFGPVHRHAAFMLIEWQLDPHAVLPAHNHTPVSVLSLCVEGSCWVEHFEIVGEAPPPGEKGDFKMKQTHAQLLRPGRSSSLTPTRDGIHTFRAGPAGALGLDLNVTLPGKGNWSMIAHEPATADGFDKLRTARWIGKP